MKGLHLDIAVRWATSGGVFQAETFVKPRWMRNRLRPFSRSVSFPMEDLVNWAEQLGSCDLWRSKNTWWKIGTHEKRVFVALCRQSVRKGMSLAQCECAQHLYCCCWRSALIVLCHVTVSHPQRSCLMDLSFFGWIIHLTVCRWAARRCPYQDFELLRLQIWFNEARMMSSAFDFRSSRSSSNGQWR